MEAERSTKPLAYFGLLAIHLLVAGRAILKQAQTYDEAVHLSSGYYFLSTGHYRIDYDNHPPLLRVIAALPLVPLQPDALSEKEDLVEGYFHLYADAFLYHNRISAERMLNISRLFLFVILSPPLLWFIFKWAEEVGGLPAGISAATLYAFYPVILAHGPLVTTDFGIALFIFLTLYYFAKGLQPKSSGRRVAIAFGLSLGAAFASKFSSIILFGILPISFIVYRYGRQDSEDRGRLLGLLRWGVPIAICVVILSYGIFDIKMLWQGWLVKYKATQQGDLHLSYMLGQITTEGWWYYFPLAFLFKSPLPFLFLLLAALFMLFDREVEAHRNLIAFVALPPLLFLAVACTSKLEIGIRHILPVVPFFCVLAGWATAKMLEKASLFRRVALASLFLLYGYSAWASYPDYGTYVNPFIMIPDDGYRYFADSNLDWGQGLKALGELLKEAGNPSIYLSYFGTADPHAYGINYVPIGMFTDVPRGGDLVTPYKNQHVVFAISANNRAGYFYRDITLMDWLRAYSPIGSVGHSIFVYDFAGNPDALLHIAHILTLQNEKDPRAHELEAFARALPQQK